MSYLKGDVRIINLSELFKMLSISGKQGTLTVTDGESVKVIYFGDNGVMLLSTGKRKGVKLGELLIQANKISPRDLNFALERQKKHKDYSAKSLSIWVF